jgi:DNA-binding NtrC family response regulator
VCTALAQREDAAMTGIREERRVWIVEDEPEAAMLAAEMCEASGASASIFRRPLTFLTALRTSEPPTAVVLDWRLERELSAALFLATRHRHPRLPVIYWTGGTLGALPAMIFEDRWVVILDKAAGTKSFEEALAWALAPTDAEEPEDSAVR